MKNKKEFFEYYMRLSNTVRRDQIYQKALCAILDFITRTIFDHLNILLKELSSLNHHN